jgi:hypothetical protein
MDWYFLVFMRQKQLLKTLVHSYSLQAGQPSWTRLALFLIYAEASTDPIWSDFLRDFEQGCVPTVLWDERSLSELQGTQVFEASLQYRCVYH